MSIEKKLKALEGIPPLKAHWYWVNFHDKYVAKHGGALHRACMKGNVDEYINREVNTFIAYVSWRVYQDNKPKPLTEYEKIHKFP